MANATDNVKKGTLRVTDEFTRESLAATVADRYFYANSMLGRNAAGYIDKFDDTASETFVGLFRGTDGGKYKQVISSAGDYQIDIHKPAFFELAISGVAITDVGRRVYASDDQTGVFTPGAFANLIGTVEQYVASGIALIRPIYNPPLGDTVQVLSANGAVIVKPGTVFVTKGTACVMTLADPTTGVHDGMVIDVISTTAAAHTLTNAGSGFNVGGAASDVGTFAAAIGNGITVVAYGGKWYVRRNTNVTLA
jgi:hypothetical protein